MSYLTSNGKLLQSNHQYISSLNTSIVYHDWFLPSKNEGFAMLSQLALSGNIGGFNTNEAYWTSSESTSLPAQYAWITTIQPFPDHVSSGESAKSQTNINIRAIRSFISSFVYNLKDVGPAGGWIFNIVNNGNGTFTYLEAAAADKFILCSVNNNCTNWSNINNTAINTTGTIIGTGLANTNLIIAQSGHISSAALICKNL